MAGNKNKVLVAVLSDLTDSQASQIAAEFSKSKNKIAPFARGTMGLTNKENVGKLLQRGLKMISE